MDVKDYRKRYEEELAAHAAAADAGEAPRSFGSSAADGGANSHLREILRVPLTHDNLGDNVGELLTVLRNAQESVPVRVAALQALRAAAFLAEKFAPYRVDFLNTLRQIARPDTPPELREGALEVLAAEKDPDAQELLRRGLREAQSALVPPTKALQLLSYDDHANIADLALDIFRTTADLGVKEAALRVLATDPKSQGLFEQLLQDKAQPLSLRTLSATGLHFLNPQKFADVARKIVLDDSDSEDIRATSLGALASTPDHHPLHSDSIFLDRVRELGADSTLKNLSTAARRMIAKP
jgi:hypothetical protein